MLLKRTVYLVILFVTLNQVGLAQSIITEKKETGSFNLVSANQTATILFDKGEDTLVQKVAMLFQSDIQKITGKMPAINNELTATKNLVVIGTIENSSFIQQLLKEKKLDVGSLKGKWEGYKIQIVKAPFEGVEQALVIAGSDRRGAAYGTLELSRQMGVSPWYWWADVPVKRKNEIYIKAGTSISDASNSKISWHFY